MPIDFDDLTIAFTTGAPRRKVLRGIGAGVLGTLAGSVLGPLAAHADCVNMSGNCTAQKCCAGLMCTGNSTSKFCCPSPTPQTSCGTGFVCDGKAKPTACGSVPGQCGCFQASPAEALAHGSPTFCGNRQIFCENLQPCNALGLCDNACYTCAMNTCCGTPVCLPNCGVTANSGTGVTTPDGLPLIL